MLSPRTKICSGYAISAQSIYSVVPVPIARNGSIRLRAFTVGSNSTTLSGITNGSRPCAYSTNAAPILCVTAGDSTPSSPSHTKPSINWCTANNVGSDANSSSRLCFTFVRVTTPIAPSTPLPTKFAVAEKHTFAVPPQARIFAVLPMIRDSDRRPLDYHSDRQRSSPSRHSPGTTAQAY